MKKDAATRLVAQDVAELLAAGQVAHPDGRRVVALPDAEGERLVAPVAAVVQLDRQVAVGEVLHRVVREPHNLSFG
jgi:hypothetical protein